MGEWVSEWVSGWRRERERRNKGRVGMGWVLDIEAGRGMGGMKWMGSTREVGR